MNLKFGGRDASVGALRSVHYANSHLDKIDREDAALVVSYFGKTPSETGV